MMILKMAALGKEISNQCHIVLPLDIIKEEKHNQRRKAMKKRQIYELSHVELKLRQISLPIKETDTLPHFPIFRIEFHLDSVLFYETCDILASVNQKEQTLKLAIGGASYKYKKADLFSFQKLAKLSLKLFRVDTSQKQQQQVDEFRLAMSQYAYEHSRSLTATVNQHAVGSSQRSFLYYSILCFYQDRVNKENEAQKKMIRISKLKKNFITLMQNNSLRKLGNSSPKLDQSSLPLSQIPFVFRPQSPQNKEEEKEEEKEKEVLISYDKLALIQASDRVDAGRVKIRLAHSHTSLKGQQEKSVVKKVQKVQRSAQHFKQWSFYLFIVLALAEILFLMSPNAKVKP